MVRFNQFDMETVKGEKFCRNYIVDEADNLIRIVPIERDCVFLDEDGEQTLWQIEGKNLVPFREKPETAVNT